MLISFADTSRAARRASILSSSSCNVSCSGDEEIMSSGIVNESARARLTGASIAPGRVAPDGTPLAGEPG